MMLGQIAIALAAIGIQIIAILCFLNAVIEDNGFGAPGRWAWAFAGIALSYGAFCITGLLF